MLIWVQPASPFFPSLTGSLMEEIIEEVQIILHDSFSSFQKKIVEATVVTPQECVSVRIVEQIVHNSLTFRNKLWNSRKSLHRSPLIESGTCFPFTKYTRKC